MIRGMRKRKKVRYLLGANAILVYLESYRKSKKRRKWWKQREGRLGSKRERSIKLGK